MRIKNILKEFPILPTTALIFYLVVVILWNINLIPPPIEVVNFLEGLYNNYGLLGLAIATFLEGIVYLGLYFPGSLIIALAVFFSDGSFISLLLISLVVAGTLTITAFINYFLGRHISFKKNEDHLKNHKKTGRGLFLSMIHPNILAFYFFNQGIERKNVAKIIWVPIIMVPYGLFFAYMLYIFSSFLKPALESPFALFILILVWLIIAFILDHRRNIKRRLIEIEKGLR